MARYVRNNWIAKEMKINFNEKQWRQDLAMYIHDKLFWSATRVTKSYIVSGGRNANAVREFKIYNSNGISIIVRYKNQNEIVYASDKDIVDKYLNSRSFN